VGVYLYNSPDLLFIWLGLLSIGAAPAMINYNLGRDALLHCVRLAGTKFLIYDAAQDCADRISDVEAQLKDLGVDAIMLSEAFKERIGTYPPERPLVACFDQTSVVLPFALMYTRYVLASRSMLCLQGLIK
jgi:acyl-CoA synthetase (AMP-forming)/AMP-acid ligase II